MEYTLINEDGTCGGIIGTEPTHNNWTLTPYLGGLIKEKHDADTDTWIESASQEEIETNKLEKLKELNLIYTDKISNLVDKYVQKFVFNGTPIPQEVIEERERLKQEYNQLKQQIK